MRAGILAGVSIGLVWHFSDILSGLNLVDIRDTISDYDFGTWATATVFTFISFWAISGYDPIINKALSFGIPDRRAASMSWKATAIAQIVGFGLITGTIIRWLELGLNPSPAQTNTGLQAFKITAAVSASFLVACSLVTGAVLAFVYLSPLAIGSIVIASIGLVIGLKVANPNVFSRLGLSRNDAGTFIILTVIDTLFAALVIHQFLPADLISFRVVFAAFLLSFIFGMISGLPGGVGPFEICMIALLPSVDPSQLAPALIAFRVVYFALPAVIAFGSVGYGLLGRKARGKSWSSHMNVPANLLKVAPPEQDLITDNPSTCAVSSDGTQGALVMEDSRTTVQLADTFHNGRSTSHFLSDLRSQAIWSKRDFCIYRCNRSTASQAQNQGMKTVRFSSEAVIRPRHFTLNVPERSGLRRKLKKATKVCLTVNSRPIQMADLAKIDSNWVTQHGNARGFSTGKFSVERVKRQRLYVAYQNKVAVAFITFSVAHNKWLLDLIRHGNECPDGAIYFLISQAIEDARVNDVDVISLGSVPFSPALQSHGIFERGRRHIFRRSNSLKGLYQFKESFRPEWEDRYFVYDTTVGAVRSILTILKAIHRTY